MKRRTNRILSILIVVLSLALLAGAGVLLVQVLPQKAPQEVTSLETNSVFERDDTVVEPEREQAYEGEIPPAAEILLLSHMISELLLCISSRYWLRTSWTRRRDRG